ncbi:MAG: Rieske (2Fe-2S) protein, partial [Anaerolineales bacterium]
MAAELLVLMAQHPVLRHRVHLAAETAGLQVVEVAAPEELDADIHPIAIVVELELPDALQAVRAWKQRWPECLVTASIALPDQERWIAAEAAGFDLVANRGALPRQLEKKLAARTSGGGLIPQRERLLAKRITKPGNGLIGRVPDAPDGEIAIFRIGERLCAIRAVCPHAGYSLADGELNGSVITCPQHGSRFDICTGERVRGPSDYPIQKYRAVFDRDEL